MNLVGVLIALLVIGVAMYLVQLYVDAPARVIFQIVLGLVLIIIVCYSFGILGPGGSTLTLRHR